MQSRRQSMIEVLTGTGIGSVGAWLITYACVKWVAPPTLAATCAVVGCTIWSLVRGYCIRRYFAKKG